MKKKDIRILLVDDEPDIIEIIKYNLEQEGYNVKTASNGKEALKKANKSTPHLIIMDVMMPEMDGIEACEILRSDNTFNDTIIMFLTARGRIIPTWRPSVPEQTTISPSPSNPKLLFPKSKPCCAASKKRRKTKTKYSWAN